MTLVPAEVLNDLKAWSEDPALPTCTKILEAMAEVSDDELEMLTFTSFKNLLGKSEIDSDLLAAVGILSSTPVSALSAEFLYTDDDHEEHFIPKTEIDEARSSGQFVHPERGDVVADFELNIVPVFRVSDRFRTLRKSAGVMPPIWEG
jgi:hypothetical protein